MMKKQKLTLKELNVKSFTTESIRGGAHDAGGGSGSGGGGEQVDTVYGNNGCSIWRFPCIV